MKILTIHSDYIKFKPLKKALRKPEELSEKRKKEIKVKEVLVVMTAVESRDRESIVDKYVAEISNIAKQVKVKNIVLYPYAHLSSDLGKPELAMEIMNEAEKQLKRKGYHLTKAPFGYYKEFELKCKGHPLSELSREITGDGKISKKEKKINYKQLLREISKSRLDTSKLKENDHRILGQKLDLFSFNEVAPGMVFWHPKGLIIKNELIDFWRREHKKAGYVEISTPQVIDNKLWKISGHWNKFRDGMFLSDYEKRHYGVKPMNCPGGMLVYRNSTKSYKDLPLRVGELGIVHRVELSGVLAGLFRVTQFTQDDAHIFCTEKQVESEVIKVMELTDKFYKVFNLPYHVELSTRPKKRIGSDKVWDKSEKVLENVLRKKKVKFKVNKGDGSFYGPKIDYNIKDSLGRTWQLATIQLDFSMPERFDLTYIGKDNKRHRPVMLHRVIYGSIERFIGILLEHTNGNLPTWLSPTQLRVISFTDRNKKYAEKTIKELQEKIPELRIDSDLSNSPINAKVRDVEIQRIPYTLVVGDKEEKTKSIAVRTRGNEKIEFNVKISDFINKLKREIII